MTVIRCVLVGDKGCGKRSVALTFLLGKCPDVIPPLFTSYTKYFDGVLLEVKLAPCHIDIENVGICENLFNKVDAVLFCFAVNDPASFDSIQQYWWSIAARYAYDATYFLVGCKSDLLPMMFTPFTPIIRTPSMILRTPTITSLKNGISNLVSRTPYKELQPPVTTPQDHPTTPHITVSSTCSSPLPVGENVVTHDLGVSMAKGLGCAKYTECTVRDELSPGSSVNNLFVTVVNKSRKRAERTAPHVVNSKVCVIL